MSSFFDMGGYAFFIWPPYIVVALIMIGLWWVSRRSLDKSNDELAALEAHAPRRNRQRDRGAQDKVEG